MRLPRSLRRNADVACLTNGLLIDVKFSSPMETSRFLQIHEGTEGINCVLCGSQKSCFLYVLGCIKSIR
jgi:hypothetical protein